jgi:hypothetical protein
MSDLKDSRARWSVSVALFVATPDAKAELLLATSGRSRTNRNDTAPTIFGEGEMMLRAKLL